MKSLGYIIILLLCISCKKEKSQPTHIIIDVSEDIVSPKHYIVAKTNSKIIIDGVIDEPAWNNAIYSDKFIDIEGVKTPKYDTRLKMLWDDEYLYVYSEMEEPHIWGNLKQRDTIIYYNNDFEVFIDPSGTGSTYGEIEINTLNTVWDLFLDKPYRVGGKANFQWNLNNLKTAVKIKGTLNDPKDIDTLWAVEMAIPLKAFVSLKNRPKTYPKEGEQWRINFSRVQWNHDLINRKYYRKKENGKYLKEYNWVWSNQKIINMHEPEKWGFLQFTENSSVKDVEFITNPDVLIKQTAFSLFRKTRYGDLKYLLDNNTGYKQIIDVIYSEDTSIKANFNKTNFGFEYKIGSPYTKKKYIINQEGTLKTL